MGQLFMALLAQMDGLNNKMDGNVLEMKNEMKTEMKEMRGEMQNMGRCLQAGITAIARSKTRAVELKMAAPRAGANELRGSVDGVGPAVETGEDKIIRETCWGRLVKVTESDSNREGNIKWGDRNV